MTPLITALAPWTVTSPHGSVIFNERSVADPWPTGAADAFLWLQAAKGLRALPDLDDNREDNTEALGEERYKEYGRGKTISCTAQIFGRTWVEAHEGADAVLEVLAPDITNGDVPVIFVVIAPAAPGVTEYGSFGCTCRSAEAVENIVVPSAGQSPSPYSFDLSFDLRMDDPRFYAWDPLTLTTGAAKW